jgi:hypothetical protein
VSDVVTGKLDVHAAAERLPVEAGEVEEVVEGADEADEGALETGEEEMVAVE